MRARYLLRRAVGAVALLIVTFALGLGGYLAGRALFVHNGGRGGISERRPPAPAPDVIIRRPQVETASGLGFPAAATKDTTRVGGDDATADAADVALAVFPPAPGVPGPDAVTLVSADDWRAGVAAAALAAPPVGAPVLLGAADSVPSTTNDALRSLAPAGSAATGGKQLLAVGGVSVPSGFRVSRAGGPSPAAVAAAVARLRQRLTGAGPAHILIASLDDPAFAMPAASWAARSGDPVLFAGGAGPPPLPTLEALHHNAGVPVYVLGPPAAVSNHAFKVIRRVAPGAKRVAGSDPVANSIALARYSNGNFGWGVDDPGHQLVIASATRPLDAAAGAALSSSGAWGPLLVTTSADEVPPELRDYLLDLKPGYVSDPTRAVYNHAWLLGDPGAISVATQARLDDLLSLVEVRSGASGGVPPPAKP